MEIIFFHNKNFIKSKIVSQWLPIILDKLMKEEYQEFKQKIGSGLATFYSKSQTFEGIREKFNSLDMDNDKSFEDIFPLNLVK